MPDWTAREVDADSVACLVREFGVTQVAARCLVGRDMATPPAAKRFLDPRLAMLRPPRGLAAFDTAAARIGTAIQQGVTIGCFGDYDVDGVSSTALIASYLTALGGRVVARVARRDAGYGFGLADVDYFVERGCQLVITADCGTSDVASIEAAGAAGADVIVVDHHTVPKGVDSHPAYALVNPFRSDSTFPFRGLASVGLAFYLMAGTRTYLVEQGHVRRDSTPDLREWLDLVALGTIADLVPLTDENRVLTSAGLARLSARERPGIAALLTQAGVGPDATIDEETVSWKLAPRLNAPGRLGDAKPALELLLARDAGQAEQLAADIEDINQRRRQEQARVTDEARAILDGRDPGPAVVVWGMGWQSGVVGIVASRLVEEYQRPAFVIAVDEETGEARGSARSVDGVNLYEVLESATAHLIRFGGHAAAAGLTAQQCDLPALREALCQGVLAQPGPASGDRLMADAEVQIGQVDRRLAQELRSLGPFGKGNSAPMLISRGVTVVESKRVGDGSHLRLKLSDGTGARLNAIGFGLGDTDPGTQATIDIAFTPFLNTWRGHTSVELQLHDVVKT